MGYYVKVEQNVKVYVEDINLDTCLATKDTEYLN